MMHGIEIVPDVLKEAVHARGGIDIVRSHRLWQKIRSDLHLKKSSSSGHTLNKAWVRCNEKNEKTLRSQCFGCLDTSLQLVVIIVVVIFSCVFLFCCLCFNRSFQINPNSDTNWCQLFLFLSSVTNLLFIYYR